MATACYPRVKACPILKQASLVTISQTGLNLMVHPLPLVR